MMTALIAAVLLKVAVPGADYQRLGMCALLLTAVLARIALASLVGPEGWSSTFLVVRSDAATHAERIGRRADDGGVIDRSITLSERSAALQFLNDDLVAPGGPDTVRAVELEARWRGYILLDRDTSVELRIDGGPASRVFIDGEATASGAGPHRLTAGLHEVMLVYTKAAGELPRMNAVLETERGAAVTAYPDPPTSRSLRNSGWAQRALRGLDLLIILGFFAWVWPSLSALGRAARRVPRFSTDDVFQNTTLLVAIPLLAFTLHGLIAASVGRELTVFLYGDDMGRYVADGRDVVLNGLLLNYGRPLFSGEPFFFYPLYPYFIALTHLLFDESLYGLVFMQFVLLGATIAILVWLTQQMFGSGIAWIALAILLILGEVDFARYYTVSAFSDNLYYPLVAAAVATMWRLEAALALRYVVLGGLFGGLATLTRPSMIFVLPLIGAWLLTRRGDARLGPRKAVMAFTATWMAVVGLATFRNWLVSERFVLLAESSLQILFFLAPEGVDFRDYIASKKPSVAESLMGALDMFRDHPLGLLVVQARKLAFMVGFTNVVPGFRLHPEFLALSAGYAGWWLMARRRAPGMVVHLTVLGHVLAFLVASPMSYGYKTILTLMMLLVPFTASLLWTVGQRVRWRAEGASIQAV